MAKAMGYVSGRSEIVRKLLESVGLNGKNVVEATLYMSPKEPVSLEALVMVPEEGMEGLVEEVRTMRWELVED